MKPVIFIIYFYIVDFYVPYVKSIFYFWRFNYLLSEKVYKEFMLHAINRKINIIIF